MGLNANGGYMFNKYFGAEAGFTYSTGYNYSWGPFSYTSNYWMLDAAVKGVLPLNDMFSVYGKLGIAYNNYSGNWDCAGFYCGTPAYSGSNTGVLLGAGVEYKLSKQLSLHLEDYTSTGPNPNFLMFGVNFNF